MEQANTILDQYKNSVDAYSDQFVGLDNFVEQYGLKTYRLGINRIIQGKVQLSSDKTVSKYKSQLKFKVSGDYEFNTEVQRL